MQLLVYVNLFANAKTETEAIGAGLCHLSLVIPQSKNPAFWTETEDFFSSTNSLCFVCIVDFLVNQHFISVKDLYARKDFAIPFLLREMLKYGSLIKALICLPN